VGGLSIDLSDRILRSNASISIQDLLSQLLEGMFVSLPQFRTLKHELHLGHPGTSLNGDFCTCRACRRGFAFATYLSPEPSCFSMFDNRPSLARPTSSSSSAHSMHVRQGAVWNVVRYHMLKFWDIETSRGTVRGNQNRDLGAAE
jgi:hypothetical protein